MMLTHFSRRSSVAPVASAALVLVMLLGLGVWPGAEAQAQAQPQPGNAERFERHIKDAGAYLQLQQFDNAAREFLAAYELDPIPELLFNAGLAYSYGNDTEAALTQYARFLERDPTGTLEERAREAFYQAAEQAWQAGDRARALDLHARYIGYSAAGSHVPAAQLRFLEYADAVWQSGDKDEALGHYERFVALAPDHEKAAMAQRRTFELAETLWRAGDKEGALGHYEEFARMEPKTGETAIARGRVFERGEDMWQAGKRDQAIGYYERYLRIEVADEIADRARARIAEYTRAQEAAALRAAETQARAREVGRAEEPGPGAGVDTAGPEVRETSAIRPRAAPWWQRLSGGVSAAMDYKGRGGAVQVGMGVDTGLLGVELRAAGLIGPTMGAYLGAARHVRVSRALGLTVGMGVPVFFSSGMRWGARGSGGVEWRVARHVAVVVELGVEHIFVPEWDREGTALVPLLGVRAY